MARTKNLPNPIFHIPYITGMFQLDNLQCPLPNPSHNCSIVAKNSLKWLQQCSPLTRGNRFLVKRFFICNCWLTHLCSLSWDFVLLIFDFLKEKNWLNIIFQCKMFYSQIFFCHFCEIKRILIIIYFYLANCEKRSWRNVSFQCMMCFFQFATFVK